MTLEKIYEMGLIKDNTEIFVRQGEGFHVLAHGNWYQDDVLNYMHHEIESITRPDPTPPSTPAQTGGGAEYEKIL